VLNNLNLLAPPREVGHSHGLDLLRAVFALDVLIFGHSIYWAIYAQGPDSVSATTTALWRATIWTFQSHSELHPAVLGLIVLSGFCIHREGLRPGDAWDRFAIRRVFRILPLFWAATVIGIILFVVSSHVVLDKAQALTGTYKLSSVCFVMKVTAIASLVPFFHRCDFLGNAPLLLVMVEIGLYAFYGLVFARGYSSRFVLAWCVASFVCGLVIAGLSSRLPPLYSWWQTSSLFAYLPYWWIGAACVDPAFRKMLNANVGKLLVFWALLTLITNYVDPTAFTAELRKIVLALLIAALIVKVDTISLKDNPGSFIGRAAYSIYAFHAPVVVLLILLGLSWWLSAAAAVTLGIVSYFALESPMNRLGQSIARRRPQAVPISTSPLPDLPPQST
jgi:peptidoglycan/LPS O-acetylase OafA/YrhL